MIKCVEIAIDNYNTRYIKYENGFHYIFNNIDLTLFDFEQNLNRLFWETDGVGSYHQNPLRGWICTFIVVAGRKQC